MMWALWLFGACSSKPAKDSAPQTGHTGEDTVAADTPGADTLGADTLGADSPEPDSPTDTGEGWPWGDGERKIRGRAWFFDLDGASITWEQDVKGAEVYVFEAPELGVSLDPAQEHTFELGGLPEGATVTLALLHPDYQPTLTGTFLVGTEDIEDVTFQVVSADIAAVVAALVGADAADESRCEMATTVTAAGGVDIWAAGEPDATVTLEPGVDPEQGPWYFNASTIPDRSLTATTTDGGVIVAGADPGLYTWTAQKEGAEFSNVEMRCEGGFLTNAAPPYGVNVL